MPISSSIPSRLAFSSRTSSIRRSSSSGVTWLPKPCEAEWSVMARYSSPRSRAAAAICSAVWRPSEAVVWLCRSPRRSSSVDQLRQARPARRRRLELAAPLAQLGRDPRQAEPLVDLLLGRAAQRLARRVVEDPVLGDVQAAAHGRLAQRDVVRLGAGEVLQHVAELVGLDDLEVDPHAGVGGHARAGVARRLDRLDERQLAQRAGQRGRVGRGGDDVDVLDRVGHAPQRARDLDALGGRVRAQGARRSGRRPAAPARAGPAAPARRPPRARRARGSAFSSTLRPKPRSPRILPASAAARSASSESIPSSS